MTRLAALGFAHESNTFSSRPTNMDSVRAVGLLRGNDIVAVHRGARSTMAGFIAASEVLAFDLVPLAFTFPTPSGVIDSDTFETIADELVDCVRKAGCDGVLLAQHGAAVSEEFRDADAEILRRIRAAVPATCKIGVVLDMHANISQHMVDPVDVTVVYRTNPHLDARERGLECADLVLKAVTGEIAPVQHLEQIPAVINIVRQSTSMPPMDSVMRQLDLASRKPGILSASVAEGYPYADVAECGMAVLVVSDGDRDLAAATARDLARFIWSRRSEFTASLISPARAIQLALSARKGPMLLLDAGDNVGGGGPGDSTIILHEARARGLEPVLAILYDPEAVAYCCEVGLSSYVELEVGGKTDTQHGDPLPIRGRVRLISDGQYTDSGPTHAGHSHYDAGTTVVIDTNHRETLVLTSHLVMPVSRQQILSLSIEPAGYRAIIAKGVVSPGPAYEPITRGSIVVATEGCTTPDLDSLEYVHRRRPLFPFESEAEYEPESRGAPASEP